MYSFKEIKKYWVDSGRKLTDNEGLKPTARDTYMQQLNEVYICNKLMDNYSIIDIGCGEGSSTITFSKQCKEIVGIDYSDTLIGQAKNKLLPDNVSFHAGDVLEINSMFDNQFFDCAISIRCLINLPTVELQYKALENIFSLIKPGGMLFLSEGYTLGWEGINMHRLKNNLEVMKVVDYNLLIDNFKLEAFLGIHGKIEEFIGFGEYLYGSRIVYPLLTKDVKHNSHINKVFAELQLNNTSSKNYKECDFAGIYVVRKK